MQEEDSTTEGTKDKSSEYDEANNTDKETSQPAPTYNAQWGNYSSVEEPDWNASPGKTEASKPPAGEPMEVKEDESEEPRKRVRRSRFDQPDERGRFEKPDDRGGRFDQPEDRKRKHSPSSGERYKIFFMIYLKIY